MRYPKPALKIEEQIVLLEGRGLAVGDRGSASRWLRRVSYYRLSAYFLPFKNGETFRQGSSFEQILDLYKFDARLRLLVSQALGRVEIAIRTSVTYEMAHSTGPFGYADCENFIRSADHAKFMQQLSVEESRSRETFVKHFRQKYHTETHLPIWMATELCSFGSLSMLYKNLRPVLQKRIAAEYEVPGTVLASWLHTLAYVRNLCAHHSRLWNRELAIKPSLPHGWGYKNVAPDRIYSVLVILQHLLKTRARSCTWQNRLTKLIEEHPKVDLVAMKMPAEWEILAPWAESGRE